VNNYRKLYERFVEQFLITKHPPIYIILFYGKKVKLLRKKSRQTHEYLSHLKPEAWILKKLQFNDRFQVLKLSVVNTAVRIFSDGSIFLCLGL